MKDPTGPIPGAEGLGKLEQEHRVPRFTELDAQIATEKGAATGGKEKKTRKWKPTTIRLGGLAKALFDDAVKAARKLKRNHRACYEADPKAFRSIVRKAQNRVFRLKPGPKPDERLTAAARERAGGAAWDTLYPKYISFHSEMQEFVRALAEDGFRRKVNGYLQGHRRMRRRATLPGRLGTNCARL